MTVPFLDLSRVHDALAGQILEGWAEALRQNAFVGGDAVAQFEKAFAEAHEATGTVAVANGTDALVLALKAFGVGPGDKVVVPAFTFIATAEAVRWLGAEPIFVDVDDSLTLCPNELGALPDDTSIKGVIAVHLYGMPADMNPIAREAEARGWFVLEDAAQAHGASYRGTRVGALGDAAAFSFYPTKNLGAMGDAGAVTSRQAELLDAVREIANHGRRGHHQHACLGINSRMDGLQAVALNAKLPFLGAWNASRRDLALRYDSALADLPGLKIAATTEGAESVYHQYVIEVPNRDQVRKAMAEAGVSTGIYYPKALVDEPAVAGDVSHAGFERARQAAAQGLALPIFPGLSESEQNDVIDALKRACA